MRLNKKQIEEITHMLDMARHWHRIFLLNEYDEGDNPAAYSLTPEDARIGIRQQKRFQRAIEYWSELVEKLKEENRAKNNKG